MKVSIWRYENEDGIGPYRARPVNPLIENMGSDHSKATSRRTPTPGRDFPDTIRQHDHFFGFPSRKAAVKWFQGWNRKLVKCGFQLKEFHVDSCHVIMSKSGRQLLWTNLSVNSYGQICPSRLTLPTSFI